MSNETGREERIALMCASLEAAYPGQGEAVMKILAPFYEVNLTFASIPSDRVAFEKAAEEAIFWRKIAGTRFIKEELRATITESFYDSIKDWRAANFGESLAKLLGPKLGIMLNAIIWPPLKDSLSASLERTLGESTLSFFAWPLFSDSLWSTIYYAVGFVILGKPNESAKLEKLLELMSQGYIPFGFDHSGNLLFLEV